MELVEGDSGFPLSLTITFYIFKFYPYIIFKREKFIVEHDN